MEYRIRTMAEKRELVADWRRSGMSKLRFARERGVPPSGLSRWIARMEGTEAEGPRFLPVHVVSDTPAAPCLVVHVSGSGHRIEVPAGFDAGELQRLVRALC
jgi:transposase-like protein